MSREAHPIEVKERARTWCEVIGPRATARKLGLKEGTVNQWCSRFNWKVPAVFERRKDYALTAPMRQGVTIARDSFEEVCKEHAEDTRLYLSTAALQTSHHFAKNGATDMRDTQALLNTARTADVVHGWTAARQQPAVQVAVQVNMPTPEEQAQREADHKRMDELTAKLRLLAPGGGGSPEGQTEQ